MTLLPILLLGLYRGASGASQNFFTQCKSTADVIDTTISNQKYTMNALFDELKNFYMSGIQFGSGGTYGYTNLCASGTYDPSKKTFESAAGSIGKKKLTIKGTMEVSTAWRSTTERKTEGRVVIPAADGITPGADQAWEAMCGFYTENNAYSNFKLTESSRTFNGVGYIADTTKHIVAKYNYAATVKGSCGSGTINMQYSGDQTTDGKKIKEVGGQNGNFFAVTIDDTKTPPVLFFKGWAGTANFKGQGILTTGYFLINQWKQYTDPTLVGGTFSPQATCAADGGPLTSQVQFEVDEINQQVYGQSGVQRWRIILTTSKTWTAEGMRDTPFGKPKFEGKLDTNPSDGSTIQGAVASNTGATTLGVTYQLVGKYGYGSMAITKYAFGCPTDLSTIPSLTSRDGSLTYFVGCGTIDATTKKFTGKVKYNGKDYTLENANIVDATTGYLKFSGLDKDNTFFAFNNSPFTPTYNIDTRMTIVDQKNSVSYNNVQVRGFMMGNNVLVFSGGIK